MPMIQRALLACLISLTVCSCARPIVLHPLTDQDIKEQDGWVCMTPAYIQEVMKARLEQKGL